MKCFRYMLQAYISVHIVIHHQVNASCVRQLLCVTCLYRKVITNGYRLAEEDISHHNMGCRWTIAFNISPMKGCRIRYTCGIS